MQFRYIGEYPAGKISAVFWGHAFEARALTNVPDADADRFKRHPLFIEVADQASASGASEEASDGSATTFPENFAQSLPTTKAELIEIAEKHGVDIDKRWGFDKIAQAIIAHAQPKEGQD